MKPEFWLNAWEEGRRGFHRTDPHGDLVAYAREHLPPGRILVPLCGATVDLGWLADNGWNVVGVELSPLAVQELTERHSLVQGPDVGGLQSWSAGGITVLQGDFFGLEVADVGSFDGIWDRAATVALHPSQRERYCALKRSLIRPGGRLLLNVLVYDASVADGPPWSVSPETVQRLWPELERIAHAETDAAGRFAEAGLKTIRRDLYSGAVSTETRTP